jgi:hypothetical protein
MYICNVGEEDAATGNKFSEQVLAQAKSENRAAVVISAKIEAEIANLSQEEEKNEFLASLGLAETGLSQIIYTGYKILDLITFFTIGPKEAHAWTLKKNMMAPKAAGVIHTDFEHGFIRAETIAYEDYVKHKGELGCKEAGKMRLEGKEYIVQDGDIFHFRFNV